MDMSLDEIILQKNIQKPGGDNGDGAKKQKLGGWLKRNAIGKLSGAAKKKRKHLAGVVARNGGVPSDAGRKFGASSEPTKLIVSNLDYKRVIDSDIAALFGEFGPLKKAGLHYDKNGQSTGSAEVIFERHADAVKAMSQYNRVPLDGREMIIQIAVSELNPPVFNTARLGVKNGGGGAKSKFYQNGTQRNGGKWSKEAEPSVEELDAELDEYVKNRI